jgi:hypothetical protein
MPVLSVLIPTTPDRQPQFERLYSKLSGQVDNMQRDHPELGSVEILYDDSKRYLEGGLSIGEKRQGLSERAMGEYTCFLDSDDDPAPDYIETLARAAMSKKDVISFKAIAKMDNFWAVIIMSLAHAGNEQLRPGFVLRKPWHICPIKSEIAKSEKFNALNHGEDVDWLNRIWPKLKTEQYLSSILTQYNHSEKNSEADKIYRHEERNNS